MPDAPQYRDRLSDAAAAEGETVLARFAPAREAYIRNHIAWAAIGGVLSVAVLWAIGRSHVIWAALLGVGGALILRGVFLYRDSMRAHWLLTPEALIGPGGERIELNSISDVRRLFGDVMVVTRSGRKLLIRYLPDPDAAVAAIKARL